MKAALILFALLSLQSLRGNGSPETSESDVGISEFKASVADWSITDQRIAFAVYAKYQEEITENSHEHDVYDIKKLSRYYIDDILPASYNRLKDIASNPAEVSTSDFYRDFRRAWNDCREEIVSILEAQGGNLESFNASIRNPLFENTDFKRAFYEMRLGMVEAELSQRIQDIIEGKGISYWNTLMLIHASDCYDREKLKNYVMSLYLGVWGRNPEHYPHKIYSDEFLEFACASAADRIIEERSEFSSKLSVAITSGWWKISVARWEKEHP